VAQVAERLPSKRKTLSSKPGTTKKLTNKQTLNVRVQVLNDILYGKAIVDWVVWKGM
jgi:hypothetical protein